MEHRIILALVVIAGLAAPSTAQERRPLTYDDYYRIQTPGQSVISPDGSRVAFVLSSVLEEENRTHSEIWLVSADGSGSPTRLTSPFTEASDPRWSADGKALFFSSPRPVPDEEDRGTTWVLRMDAPGEAFRIRGLEGAPLFEPTGRRIAFTRPVLPAGPRPTSFEAATEVEQKIVDRFDGRAFEWMQFRFDRRGYLPDPKDPWTTPATQIFVLPSEGGTPRQITELDVSARNPAWRHDGEALVFVADAHQRDEHSYERSDLWTVTVDGALQRLTDDERTTWMASPTCSASSREPTGSGSRPPMGPRCAGGPVRVFRRWQGAAQHHRQLGLHSAGA